MGITDGHYGGNAGCSVGGPFNDTARLRARCAPPGVGNGTRICSYPIDATAYGHGRHDHVLTAAAGQHRLLPDGSATPGGPCLYRATYVCGAGGRPRVATLGGPSSTDPALAEADGQVLPTFLPS